MEEVTLLRRHWLPGDLDVPEIRDLGVYNAYCTFKRHQFERCEIWNYPYMACWWFGVAAIYHHFIPLLDGDATTGDESFRYTGFNT